ncbi:MAG TPA: efflux RND transporter periplasmic adaptor subunit [Bryobacteraceae bacterium]
MLTAYGCGKPAEKEVEAPAPVQVTAVTQDTVRRIVAGDGVLFPLDQQNVMPKITSPVQKFYANRGDHVKAGQVLAVLEHRDLTAQAGESKGALDQAESNLRITQGASVPEAVIKAQTDVDAARQTVEAAKRLLDSREALFKEGALPRRQVDEQQVNYAQANAAFLSAQEHLRALQSVSKNEQIKTAAAQVESAKSHLQSVEAQVQYSEVRSPMNGVVADRPLYAGDMASTGIPLFVIMDISRVVARVNVPQSDASSVKIGQPAELTITGVENQINGKVTVVSPATDANSTTVQVWIQADNPGETLKPGAAVHAKIVVEIFKATPVVPAAAILPGEEGGTAVLVISSDSVAHRRLVRLGVREGNKVQIASGVNPGEDVVIVGGLGVDDKAKVKIIDATAKEADEDENPEPEPDASKAGKDQKKDEAKPKAK